MTEPAIGYREAAKITGMSPKTLQEKAAAGELNGTWFWAGGRRKFLESRLRDLREKWVESASSNRKRPL